MNDGFQLLRGVAFALLLASAALCLLFDSAGTTSAATLVARTIATLGGAAMVAAVVYAPLEVILVALWRAAVYRRAEFSDTHVAIQPGAPAPVGASMTTKFLAYLSLAVACAAQAAAIAATPPAPPPAPDESFSAGKQLGQTQLSGTVTGIKSGSSTAVVPNYNTNPPQKAIYNSGSTTDAAQTARANCLAHPDDPTCAGYLQATQSRPPSDVTAADPALAGAGAAADPTTILGNISDTYSSCTSGTPTLVTSAQFERDSCSVNTNSWTTNTCDKTLTVYPSDTNSCTQGTYYGSNSAQFDGSADVAFQKVFCDMTRNDGQIVFRIGVGSVTQDVPVAVATPMPAAGGLPLIVANLTLPEEDWTDYNASRQTFPTVDVYLVNHGCTVDGSCTVDFFFFMAQTGYYKACTDCLPPDYFSVPAAYFTPDGAGGYTIVAGGPQAHTTLTFLKPGLAHKAGDYWSSTCAPYEKLTSVLPQDGINPSPPLAVPVLNQLNAQQCSRTQSVCTDGPRTKIINGVPETRACWHWADTFDCTTLNATSTCTDPRFRSCSQAGAPTCTLDDGHGHCLDSQAQFDCKTADAVYSPSVNCGGASDFCAGGSCYPTTYQTDKDFALSVSMLEAQREAGRYYDPTNLRIFPGTESQCKDELFGLNDCCATGHTSAWDAFKNSAVGGASVSQIGKMALSSFTYDGLFTDLKPDWSLKGLREDAGHRVRRASACVEGRRHAGQGLHRPHGAQPLESSHAGPPDDRVGQLLRRQQEHRDQEGREALPRGRRILLSQHPAHRLPDDDAHVLLLPVPSYSDHQRAGAAAAVPRLGRRPPPCLQRVHDRGARAARLQPDGSQRVLRRDPAVVGRRQRAPVANQQQANRMLLRSR